MHYLLIYDVAADYLSRRGEFRREHLVHAWKSVERGEMLLGGALGDPVDAAVVLFDVESPEAIERFVRDDPYVRNGLVAKWRIRPWTTVAGAMAHSPVRPEDLPT